MATRTVIVTAAEAGRSLGEILQARLGLAPGKLRRLLDERQVQLGGRACTDPRLRLRRGQRLEIEQKAHAPQPSLRGTGGPKPRIRYADDQIVIVDKPYGMTTVRHADEAAEFGQRGQRFLPPTLADVLPSLLAGYRPGKPGRLRAVHRLDRDTSGLVVFARTPEAERKLGQQFRDHTVERKYLAVVRGKARTQRIESWLTRDRGDGRRGSTANQEVGKRAVTNVQVVEELGEFTLVECRLETGRTHQVRIHLGESGTPICGEIMYDRPPHGEAQTDRSGTLRLALHAATLGIKHPTTGRQMMWSAPLPKDLQTLLERLGRKKERKGPGRPREVP